MKSDIESWIKSAACTGYSFLFYPHDNERNVARTRRETRAKAICAQCSVMQKCKEYARANAEFGIWGGENEEDRYAAGYTLPRYSGVTIKRRIRETKEEALTHLVASRSAE